MSDIVHYLGRIADALDCIVDKLDSTNIKISSTADPYVQQPDQYTIYVSAVPMKNNVHIIGAELTKGSEQKNAFVMPTTKDPVYAMLLAVYTCLQQVALRQDSNKPVDIVTDNSHVVQGITDEQGLSGETLSLIHTIKMHARNGIQASLQPPTHHMLANVINEILTERERICSQSAAQESSTQTAK